MEEIWSGRSLRFSCASRLQAPGGAGRGRRLRVEGAQGGGDHSQCTPQLTWPGNKQARHAARRCCAIAQQQ